MSAGNRIGVPDVVARLVLGVLGAVQLTDGLYALLAPRSFYGDFPLGRGWVEVLPAYNEHLVRDVGGLFLGTGILLLAAAFYLERRLVSITLISFLAFSVPHFVYHLLNLGPYGTADAIANVVTLLLTVLAPVALLAAMARSRDPRPVPGGSAPAAVGTNGRIAGVPDSTRNPLIRTAFRSSRKSEGAVIDPLRLYAHHPTLLAGYGGFELATQRAARVAGRLKHLAELRAAMLSGCEWCLDYGSAVSTAEHLDRADLEALPGYASSDRFDETERLVLDYASGMSRTPVEVPDELFDRLRERFDEAQLVELTSVIALENYRARFNWAFGLAGQGFTDGAYCVRPAGVIPDQVVTDAPTAG